MRAKLSRWGSLAAMLTLSACGPKPEVDQIAQSRLIGLSEKKILACLGEPAKRVAIGTEQIWTFRIGQMLNEGGLLALGLNEYATPFPPDRACNVNVVIDRHGVSQVTYAKADGRALPLGQLCEFDVNRCVGR